MKIRILILGTILATVSGQEPFTPSSDDAVLERLPMRFFMGNSRNPGRVKAQLPIPLNDSQLAAEIRACLAASRASGDPRLLGHAQKMLGEPETLSPELRVLKAIVLQRLHHFDQALAELNLALQRQPGHAQAWLTKGSILQLQGRYAEAEQAFRELARHGPAAIANAAYYGVRSHMGAARESLQALEDKVMPAPNLDRESEQWIYGLAADIAERLGDAAKAEKYYKAALIIDPHDLFSRGAYCDFLLEQARPAEALKVITSLESDADGILLREAISRVQTNADTERIRELREELSSRFRALQLRGDRTHLREEARFQLQVLNRPDLALPLAHQNWKTQKEPFDALLVLKSAAAQGGKAESTAAVRHWMRASKIEDARLQKALAGGEAALGRSE